MKKRYFAYKDKLLFDGHKLLEDWQKSSCPIGGNGLHCGFPEKFIIQALKRIEQLSNTK